ncbi:uncharacterized protein LOC127427730 [Myxocyprinus asiaticus]|uniref:uncharacterized protein LOC127427730 n=1 Tax=Myxocyprinus asiaticus TaxID=70543 RepID=UPI002223475B|nr:uncharacterized protein LOC127427730 [Myxocyprinus asiaticus]
MDLKKTDTGTYYYSLTQKTDKNSVFRNITVYVTDFQVYVERDTVTEGQNISLTCNTSRALKLTANSHTFIWYKNKRRLNLQHSSNKLNLIAVSSEDTGRYSCALKDLETFPSEEKLIIVKHGYVWNKRTVIITLSSLLILLFICGTLWMKRKKLIRTEEKEHNTQNDNVYSNVAALAETSDLEERERSHQDEVQYSRVHFSKFTNDQFPSVSAADVQYAAINVREHSTAT